MPSHRFSMFLRVGFEIAVDDAREAAAGALRTRLLRSRLEAGVRSILAVFANSRWRDVNWQAYRRVDSSRDGEDDEVRRRFRVRNPSYGGGSPVESRERFREVDDSAPAAGLRITCESLVLDRPDMLHRYIGT